METSTDTFTAAPAAPEGTATHVPRATTVGALTVESASPARLDAPHNPMRAFLLLCVNLVLVITQL